MRAKGMEALAARPFYRHRKASGWRWAPWVSVECRHLAGLGETWCAPKSPVPNRCLAWRAGRFKPIRATIPLGRAPFTNSIVFLLFKLAQICKLPNWLFLSSKFLQTLHEYILTHYEQLSFLKKVQIQKRIWIKNLEANCFWIWAKFIGGSNLIGKIW
jgi:hypothetical protein